MKHDTPIIHTSRVTKFFRDDHHHPVIACEDITIDVKPNELVCIVGPSGCGKSTFLRIVAGLMKADSGEVKVADDARLSMIFQNAALFPWLTVSENIAYGLAMQGESQEVIAKHVKAQIKHMGLEAAANLHPKELSGGMKQRVGIARALAVDPDILLLDEPFSALDAFTAERLRADFLTLWRKERWTMLMVTHLVEEAVQMADRIVVMSKRPGKVKAIIDVKLPRPRQLRSPAFFKIVDQVRELVIPEHDSL